MSITDNDEDMEPAQRQEEEPAPEPSSVSVEPISLSITEGGEPASYEVVLDSRPSANVVIDVSSDNDDVTPHPVEARVAMSRRTLPRLAVLPPVARPLASGSRRAAR